MAEEVVDLTKSIFSRTETEPKVETDIVETVAETPEVVTEGADPNVSVSEPEVEVTPWYKELEFEDESTAKEFVKKYKNFQPEVPKPKFAAPEVEKYNKFVEATGINDFTTFQTVSKFSTVENPSEDQMIDAIIAKKIYDDPELKGDEAYLKQRLMKQYKLDVDLDYADDDEKYDVKESKRALKKEFEGSAGFFKEINAKLDVAPVDNTKLEVNQKAWESEILKDKADELKIDIPVLKKNDKGELVATEEIEKSITFDKQMHEAYVRNYKAVLNAQGWPDLESGVAQQAKAYAAGLTLAENIYKVINDAVSHGYGKAVKDHHIEVENPSAVGTHRKIADTGEKSDTSSSIFKR
jgi:hypothetical protein